MIDKICEYILKIGESIREPMPEINKDLMAGLFIICIPITILYFISKSLIVDLIEKVKKRKQENPDHEDQSK